MKVTCPSCQSKYTIADEKVRGKTVKIRCRKCSATILADGTSLTSGATNGAHAEPTGAEVFSGEASASSAGADGSYHVNIADGDQRVMTVNEIVAAYHQGLVHNETFVWTDGMAEWQPLGEVEPLVSALHASGTPAHAAPPPAAAPEPQVARRVERQDGRGSRDLFVEAASQEVVTSAPTFTPVPAPVASASAAVGPSSSASPASSDGAPPGPTGQRGENSVLFSLAALTKAAPPEPVNAKANNAKDDSGIIDLKALAAAANRPASAAPQAAVPPPLFPLGAPADAPPLALGAQPAAEKNKWMLYVGIGGAVAFVASIVMVTVVLLRGEPPKEQPPLAASAPSPPAPTVSAAPAETATAAASASASASATVAAKPPTVGGGGGGGKTSYKPAGGGGGGSKPAAAPQKPANSDPCGCAGDLMCLMKCSTRK